MNNKIIYELSKYYECLFNENGTRKAEAIGIIKNAGTTSDGLTRLYSLLEVMISSDVVSEDTKMLIKNNGMTVKKISEVLSTSDGENRVGYAASIARIRKDTERVTEIFGTTLIRDCVYNRLEDYSMFDSCLTEFVLKFGRCNKIRENLIINIDTEDIGKTSYCNNAEFFNRLDSVQAYLKARIQVIESALNMDKDFVGYFNYLLSELGATDEEVKVDRERLIKFLNNEDFMTGYIEESILDDMDI